METYEHFLALRCVRVADSTEAFHVLFVLENQQNPTVLAGSTWLVH